MTKNKMGQKTAAVGQVPPYCYRRPGMSAEAGAVAAVNGLGTIHSCDALALLWELRRGAKNAPEEVGLYTNVVEGEKTQQRPFVKAGGKAANERNNA